MATTPSTATHPRRIFGRGIDQAVIALLGLMYVPTALQAAFMPRSFFDDFPGGRGWVAVDGVYNQHLVRDVGALYLALVIVSLWAWWRPALCLPVAVAWLVSSTLHLVYHAGSLDNLDGADAIALVVTLAAAPVLAIVAIVAGRALFRVDVMRAGELAVIVACAAALVFGLALTVRWYRLPPRSPAGGG